MDASELLSVSIALHDALSDGSRRAGADLQVSALAAAAQHRRRATVALPLPPSHRKDASGVAVDLQTLPPLTQLCQGCESVTALPERCVRLLQWLLLQRQNRCRLSGCPLQEIPNLFPLDLPAWRLPSAVVRVTTDPMADDNGAARPGGVRRLAFHGTRFENLHSILHLGLLNSSGTAHQRNGALFGSGIYLSTSLNVVQSFAQPAAGWVGSALGRYLSCVLVCEVLDPAIPPEMPTATAVSPAAGASSSTSVPRGSQKALPPAYIVVEKPEHLRLAYILLFNHDADALARQQWWRLAGAALFVALAALLLHAAPL